jgi:hypothetical protein
VWNNLLYGRRSFYRNNNNNNIIIIITHPNFRDSVCPRPRLKVHLTLSDPMSDLVRLYAFPVPDAFLDL